ncbi:MAG: FAD-dependent oxidoreductase [Anaerolineales bacterium]
MENNTADVLIIGAGVHGASLAHALSRRGARVILLERRHTASGATGRSSGLVRMHYDLEVEAQLAWESFGMFRRWQELIGGECGFIQSGFLFLAHPKSHSQLRANVAMQQRIGIGTEVVTAQQVHELAPALLTEDFKLAAYEPESGYADPTLTTAALVRGAQNMGARLIQDSPVSAVTAAGGIITGVETQHARYSAPVVVNAAGAWAGPVARLAGLELPLTTWRHDIAFLRRPSGMPGHPAVIDQIQAMYFRPETGGLTLIGLEDGNPLGLSPDEDGGAPQGFVDRAVDRLCRRIPGMVEGSLHSTQGGFDGITPDQHALIGPAGPEGFYLDCGYSGTGFKIAPAVGESLAVRIHEGVWGVVDLSPFDPTRFDRGEPLQSDNPYEMMWR